MKRRLVQWLTLLGSNAYIPGFLNGRIYKGELKSFCVPGLNCYSCPGALGSCPLGSLQAVLGSLRYRFSFYVTGLMLGFGLLFGRLVCGFLCPFGLLQELIHKIPFYRVKKPWHWPIYIKYALLIVFVIALPLLARSAMGVGKPAFCQYVCPAGTLTGGVPLLIANPLLRKSIGWLFALKMTLAVATVVGCLMITRFFCRCLCPLGAFYGLFNGVALYRLRLEERNCVRCGACARTCPMGVDPSKTPDSPECIRCGDCVKACRFSALGAGFAQWEKRAGGDPVRNP